MTSMNRTTRTRSSGRLAASRIATARIATAGLATARRATAKIAATKFAKFGTAKFGTVIATTAARTAIAITLGALLTAISGAAPATARTAATLTTASGPSAPGSSAPGVSTPGTSPNTATFGIQPATGEKPDSRARLTYSATPGARISDHIAVQNFSTQPLQLHVYANDAFNTADGGFDIQAAAIAPTDLGAWVHLAGSNFITVPARAIVIVPITVIIPVNATPGDHAGGIVAGLNRIATDAKGNRVNVEERVGTRIYIRVPGALSAALTLTNVKTTYHNSWNPFGAGSATVTYTVRNTGNVRLAGALHISVSSFAGGTHQAVNVPNQAVNVPSFKELLPGQQISYSSQIGGVLPSFVITGRVTVDPSALPGDIDPKASSVSGSASTISMPWAQLIVVLLLAGLAFEFFRRRRRPATAPASPAKKSAAGAGAAKAGAAGVKTGG